MRHKHSTSCKKEIILLIYSPHMFFFVSGFDNGVKYKPRMPPHNLILFLHSLAISIIMYIYFQGIMGPRKNRGMPKRSPSRIANNNAINSSVANPTCFSCTTFNILAPIYKRLTYEGRACRESTIRAYWLNRNEKILYLLLSQRSSIICLQEFWVDNEELVDMYDQKLGDAGYISFKLPRTNNRGDGLLTAVHQDYFRVIDHREFLFNDFGDRVAQLLHVEVIAPFAQCRSKNVCREMLIVNTHLLFPHDSSLSLERLRQVYKILQSVDAYQKENNLDPLPIVLCGDWNGSKRGHVYKFLRSQGFESSYDTAHHYTDADAHKWISHRNHRGNICGVDFIWFLNPNKYRKLLKTSWSEAVFGLFKYQVSRASLNDDDAFAFLKAVSNGNHITYTGFCEALRQLHLIGQAYGLSEEEIEDLWLQADVDGNGVLDYEEFQQRIWNPMWSYEIESSTQDQEDNMDDSRATIGLDVNNAELFPTETENGCWPEDYSLSDHASLTVVFSPIRMTSSRLNS